jgi:hypothetical protein
MFRDGDCKSAAKIGENARREQATRCRKYAESRGESWRKSAAKIGESARQKWAEHLSNAGGAGGLGQNFI